MYPFPNEVFIDHKEKERLVELLTEADAILDKYPYSTIPSYDTVTSMSDAKCSVHEAKHHVKLLCTEKDAK